MNFIELFLGTKNFKYKVIFIIIFFTFEIYIYIIYKKQAINLLRI